MSSGPGRIELRLGAGLLRPRVDLAHRRDPAAAVGARREQSRDAARHVEGDEPLGARVVEDPLVPAQVVLELGETGRRIDGERDSARELNSEKALGGSRTPVGSMIATARPGVSRFSDQPRGHAARALEERAVAEHRLRLGPVDETDVLALRMLCGVPRKGVDQGLGIAGDRIRFGLRGGFRGRRRRTCAHDDAGTRRARGRARSRSRCRGPNRLERAQELARSGGLGEHPIREARAGRALNAGEELHPRETVEPEVPVEIGVEVDAE